ncbi:hypothetical protein OV079_24195 [Nannocystis pusilla]|uniref:Lipoprotein n=1 Tax=Nannocystis pusilla TaxID=889268 RepID=A0A9X3IYL1_9BACT|nr:hypothetical protein [Nannocystis pusilla]MCY1008606.1 hypothetical protein [Nannocystis pusilla]
MHLPAAVASLFLSLFAAPATAESPPAPVPRATADDFYSGLEAPITQENVRVSAEDGYFEVSFNLREVGRVSITVYWEDEGSGRGHVTVGEAVVAEVSFVDGVLASEWADLTGLQTHQVQDVLASVVQAWQKNGVTEALGVVSRDGKCEVAGNIAGASTGTLVGAGCLLLIKKKWCVGAGSFVSKKVTGWITGKCNGAQNG